MMRSDVAITTKGSMQVCRSKSHMMRSDVAITTKGSMQVCRQCMSLVRRGGAGIVCVETVSTYTN